MDKLDAKERDIRVQLLLGQMPRDKDVGTISLESAMLWSKVNEIVEWINGQTDVVDERGGNTDMR